MEGRLVISVPEAKFAYKRDSATKEPKGTPLLRFAVAWGFVGGAVIDEGKKYIMRCDGCIGAFDKTGKFQWGPAMHKFGYRYMQMNTMTADLHDAVVDALEKLGIVAAYRKKIDTPGPITTTEGDLIDPVTVGNFIVE